MPSTNAEPGGRPEYPRRKSGRDPAVFVATDRDNLAMTEPIAGLIRRCAGKLSTRSTFDDLVQEGRMAAITCIRLHPDVNGVCGILVKYVYLAMCEWNRRDRKHEHGELSDLIPSPPDGDVPGWMLDSLPPRGAETVILRLGLDGGLERSWGDVGDMMGIRPSTAVTHWHRAMAELRARIPA